MLISKTTDLIYSRSLYRCVKDLKCTKTAGLSTVKAEDGKILTESEEIKNRWKNYCESLYASQELVSLRPVVCAPDEEPDVLLSEVENTVRRMKNNKSPCANDIPSELLKCMDDVGIKLLNKLCNKIWQSLANRVEEISLSYLAKEGTY